MSYHLTNSPKNYVGLNHLFLKKSIDILALVKFATILHAKLQMIFWITAIIGISRILYIALLKDYRLIVGQFLKAI